MTPGRWVPGALRPLLCSLATCGSASAPRTWESGISSRLLRDHSLSIPLTWTISVSPVISTSVMTLLLPILLGSGPCRSSSLDHSLNPDRGKNTCRLDHFALSVQHIFRMCRVAIQRPGLWSAPNWRELRNDCSCRSRGVEPREAALRGTQGSTTTLG